MQLEEKCFLWILLEDHYDFIVVAEVPSFETFAAIKLAVESSGAVRDLTALEAMDLTSAAKKAGELTGNYKAPGQ